MVNLVTNTLSWSRGIISVNGRSHVIRHILILQIFSTLKKLCFWQNREKVFNRLNSRNWVELHKGHVQESKGEVMCKSHAQGACKLTGVICIYEWAEFNDGDFLRVKCKCQLVVRLNANKCYKELLRSLSSDINFLNIRLFAQVFGLYVSATGNIIITTSGFLLIVLLIILLWSHCSGRIIDCIALIALIASLWPYC